MAGATTSAGRHAISSAVNADATVTAAAIAVMLGFFVWEFHQFHHRELRRPAVRETIAIQALARDVQAVAGAAFPLTYVADSPFAMQLALNTMRPPVSVDEAAALLRGDAAAFVVTAHPPKLVRALGTGGPPVRVVARATDGGAPYLFLVSNRPVLATYARTATRVGPLVVTLSGVRLGPTWDNVLDLRRGLDAGDAVIENVSTSAMPAARTGRSGAAGEGLRCSAMSRASGSRCCWDAVRRTLPKLRVQRRWMCRRPVRRVLTIHTLVCILRA